MDFGDLLGKMEDAAREEHEKHKAAEIRECGCVPIGGYVARLIKKWPSKALVEAGELDAEEMDGEGAMPELTLYRPHKRAIQLSGRAEMDALADLLTSNGYGVAGRQRKPSDAPERAEVAQ